LNGNGVSRISNKVPIEAEQKVLDYPELQADSTGKLKD